MDLKKNETLQTKNFRPNGPIFLRRFSSIFLSDFRDP